MKLPTKHICPQCGIEFQADMWVVAADLITKRKGDYIFSLKENRKGLFQDVKDFFQISEETGFDGIEYETKGVRGHWGFIGFWTSLFMRISAVNERMHPQSILLGSAKWPSTFCGRILPGKIVFVESVSLLLGIRNTS